MGAGEIIGRSLSRRVHTVPQRATQAWTKAMGNRSFSDFVKTAIEYAPVGSDSEVPTREHPLNFTLRRLQAIGRENIEHLYDMLPAAWQLSDAEFELLLGVPPEWLAAYRNHEVEPAPETWDKLRDLFSLHQAMRKVVRPQGYGPWLRRQWQSDSPIGGRSPLQAMLDDGDVATGKVKAFCLSA